MKSFSVEYNCLRLPESGSVVALSTRFVYWSFLNDAAFLAGAQALLMT